MNKTLTFTAALSALLAVQANALELARVVSTTPVMQQVAVPQQVCNNEEVAVAQPRTGLGATMGAIAGGALGASTHGSGRAPATVIGALGGAVIGDRLEGNSVRTQTVQRCTTQTSYENRPVAFNVVYEFAGKQFSTTVREDPGTTLPVEVTPTGAINGPAAVGLPSVAVAAAPANPVIYQQPPYPQTIYSHPTYPTTIYAPIYQPPVVVSRPHIDPIYPAVVLGVGLASWGAYRYGHVHRHHGGGRRWH